MGLRKQRTQSAARLIVRLTAAVLAAAALRAGRALGASEAKVTADRVLIEKSGRRLTLFSHGVALKSFLVALGRNPVGPKREQGDGKTPEGTYVIDFRVARSSFHRALHISYPNFPQPAPGATQDM
jgi:murein L,D-transpeptidase YafK